MISTEAIEMAFAKSRLPAPFKLFLLGISGKKVMRMTRRRVITKNPRRTETARDEAPSTKSRDDIRARLKEWTSVDENIRSDFSIDQLAAQLSTGRKAIERYFESAAKQDFRYWKTFIRIERAQTLLLENESIPVIDIAKTVGFNDKSNFHKKFKEITGCTPSQWRECGGHPEIYG